MKTIRLYIPLLLLMILGVKTMSAQDGSLKLTNTQKELLQAQKEQLKKNRALFIASLNESQINILRNRRLSQFEQKRAIMASLTKRQKLILLKNQEALKNRTDAFRATLTDRQKVRLRHLLTTRDSLLDGELIRNRKTRR